MGFDLDKQNILGKEDKSKIQQVDDDARDIVDLLNGRENYYTTSSCSGRIVLLEKEGERKNEAGWLLAEHNPITFEQVKSSLADAKHDVWFKQEPAILHVACRSIEDAEKLIKLCKDSGFKRSGMIMVNKRYVVEVIGTEMIACPVAREGNLAADDSYLNLLVEEANRKIKKNKEKLGLLLESLKSLNA